MLPIKFITFNLAIFLWSSISAQNTEVRSDELDRLVWTKINDRLVKLGKKPIAHFEDSLTRQFAARTATRLAQEGAPFEHSVNDSISYYCNGMECIHRETTTSLPVTNNKRIQQIQSGNLDSLAQSIVDGWVSSPDHNRAISKDIWEASTVETVIVYNTTTGRFRMTAVWMSWHNPNVWVTTSGYRGDWKSK